LMGRNTEILRSIPTFGGGGIAGAEYYLKG
jgi:hypothetical protein